MKIEGKDKYDHPWWVESNIDVNVQICPNCRNPVAVINTAEHQAVEKVVFHSTMSGKERKKHGLVNLGEFELTIRTNAEINFSSCPWCGWMVDTNMSSKASQDFRVNSLRERATLTE